MRQVIAPFPPKLIGPLLESTKRYIILYGGRGGGKSWAVARALLIRALNTPMRILCCREYMSAVADSQHKLLSDQVHQLGLEDRFTIEKSTIYSSNGSEFRFAGIRNNPDTIRSFEGVDVCWVEEAATVTLASWQTLIPTIRKETSQIIITFNPVLASDETYRRFVTMAPPNSVVLKVNFDDNPFCPQVLMDEANYLKDVDPDAYQNIWLGYPRVALENAIYGKELRACQEENRIAHVPYDDFTPVHCFYDLGWRDSTSIILAQYANFEYHVIDFVQGSKRTISDYIRILQAKPYVFGIHYLPHDAGARDLRTGRSIEQIMRAAGLTVRVMPRLQVADGINAARLMWPRVWLDQIKCADLIQALRNYRWDDEHKSKPEPLHDENSHAADAFRLMALSLKDAKKPYVARDPVFEASQTGWMS